MPDRLTLQEWHERSHYFGYGAAVPMALCWFCQRNAATCKRKVAYGNPREAHEAALDHSQRDEWGKVWSPYRCRYCDGYHLTTKVTTKTARRSEKQRRKALRTPT